MPERSGSRRNEILWTVAAAAAYLACLRVGVVFKDPVSRLSSIWPASGVALAVLLLRPRREWPRLAAVLLATGFAHNLWVWHSVKLAVLFAVANFIEFWGIATVFMWKAPFPVDFRRIQDTVRLLVCTIVLEAVPATVAGAGLAISRDVSFTKMLISWWSSNVLGMLVIAPLIICWAQYRPRARSAWYLLEMSAFGLGWIATVVTVFSPQVASLAGVMHPYMLLPMIMWAALRFGVTGVTASVIVVAGIATLSTISGEYLPFGGVNPAARLLMVQVYVAIAQATGLLLAGARAQLVRAERDARDGSERLTRALQAARMGTWDWEFATGNVCWSSDVTNMFGVAPDGRGFDWYLSCVHPADKPALIQSIQDVISGGVDCRNEHRFKLPSGEVRWVEVRGRVVKNRSGVPVRMVGTAMDATARRMATESLRRASRALKALSSCNQVVMRATNEQQLLDGVCQTAVAECGYRLAWVGLVNSATNGVRIGAQAGIPRDLLEQYAANIEQHGGNWLVRDALATGEVQACHDVMADPRAESWRAAAERHRCKAALIMPLVHEGRAYGVIGVYAAERNAFDDAEVDLLKELSNDLSFGLQALRTRIDHDRAQDELAVRETILEQLIRHTPAAVAMFDRQMRYISVSETWIKDYHLYGKEIIGRSHYALFPNLPQKWKDVHARVLAGGPVERCEEDDFPQPDGTVMWLQWEVRPWHESSGRIGGVTMFTQVITARKQAETALRRQRRRADAIIQAAMDGIVTIDEAGFIQTFNPAAERMFRVLSNDAIGLPIDRFLPHPVIPHKGFRPNNGNLVQKFSRLRTRNEISGAFGEVVGRRADGVEFPVEAFISHTDLDGHTMLTVTLRDLTERMSAERALRESEERFRQVVENIQEVFWMSDATRSRLLYVSPAYEKIYGSTPDTLTEAPQWWLQAVHPDDRDRVARAAMLRLTRGDYHEEYRIVRPDGSIRWVTERAVPVRGADGKVYRIVGVAEDVTERRRIEDQFRQAQKMEAIGQLAGGVAHDFNNILGAIMMAAGEAEYIEGMPPEANQLIADLTRSAERAANLTRQLLLFSRRQVMRLGELDVNTVVTDVARMLRRIVGEDIDIVMRLDPSRLTVQADAGMLEQILVNLCVNARDAMPAGGELLIETAAVVVDETQASRVEDATPGPHVRLRVRDFGSGISPELLNRIFEPFFTTKEPGRGTGLGLATVFGIVKQHRGWITVESELGKGTTFEVFIPHTVATPSPVGRISDSAAARGGNENILLVEDDPDIRKFARMVLQRVGYSVVDAASGVEAEELWREHDGRFDLLFTDMVMPDGINGRELARRLRARDSALKVIVTSGYSDEFAGRAVGADVGDAFLPKPWKPHQMLDAIRRCLDAARN